VARPVLLQLDRFGARSVLDLGCGNGWLTAALSRCGFDVTGLDSSRSGIAIARGAHRDVAFRQADALLPPAPELQGRFDAVVAVEAVDHVSQPRVLLQHALTMLRPGGLLVVTTPYHGYFKNLGLALSGRFDRRLHALEVHGRLKFFSRQTLTALVAECGYADLHFETIGRLPAIARSMLVTGKRPLP
jgi:2-polyprenyl-6-hydroxyphenyl methylase/3-demethylubiquinone-9 3-methyltransferase